MMCALPGKHETAQAVQRDNGLAAAFKETSSMENSAFEVGDQVILDTGEDAVIAAIYRDFAWVFSDIEGFETVEISELRWPDPPSQLAL